MASGELVCAGFLNRHHGFMGVMYPNANTEFVMLLTGRIADPGLEDSVINKWVGVTYPTSVIAGEEHRPELVVPVFLTGTVGDSWVVGDNTDHRLT